MKTIFTFDFTDGVGISGDVLNLDIVPTWLGSVLSNENKEATEVLYVFCDDPFLLDINQQYLRHDTLTDIITFPYSTSPIRAEIYISVDRVYENAQIYSGGDTSKELLRTIVHGLLHMCGYGDKTEEEVKTMRDKESKYIELFFENSSNKKL